MAVQVPASQATEFTVYRLAQQPAQSPPHLVTLLAEKGALEKRLGKIDYLGAKRLEQLEVTYVDFSRAIAQNVQLTHQIIGSAK